MMRPSHLLAYCFLVSPCLAEPVISEFMASNQNGITDENGSRPDWIEVKNPDATPVIMTGWALTDAAANPQKWIFPAVTIAPNSQLLVFASGNDRRVAGQNLHTNFSLSAGGEYLALVRPGGTAVTEWSPAYPQQYPNISYGHVHEHCRGDMGAAEHGGEGVCAGGHDAHSAVALDWI